MIKPLTLVLSIALVLGSVSYVGAQATITQQLRSLSEIMSGNYEQTYPLVRCAALYQSSIEWAGKARIGQETFERFDRAIRNLLAISVFLRSQKNGISIKSAEEITLLDTRTIADMYLERYRTNYASTGQAWGSDTMWREDLQICQKLAAGLK